LTGKILSKPLSLLRFQLKVLSAYFKKSNWDKRKTKEFSSYLFYYTLNFWYYLFLSTFEDLTLKNQTLKKVDKMLADIYNENNQFWVSLKEGYRLKNERIINLTYGETSYFAIKQSLEFVKLTKDDVFYDLGCGIGKTVFYASCIYGAKAIGVDIIPDFIRNGNQVVQQLRLENISFIERSIFDLNLKNGTVFYVTPTCFDQENMNKLIKKFGSLPSGSRLIVLSKEIRLPNLELLGKKKLYYSWGKAETYYYRVI
jgi:SAM-dependent methyltransferase